MKKFAFSRRNFLHGLGVSAAAVPLVLGLDSLYAKAAAPAPKKRFVFMYSPAGMYYYNWRLRLPGADVDISDGSAFTSPNLILQPLQANAKHLLVLDRLSWKSARQVYQTADVAPDKINHPGGEQKGMGSLLTGQVLTGGTNSFQDAGLANGISLDQVLATQVFQNQVFASLEVGVQTNENLTDRHVEKCLSYAKPATPRAPQNDPFALFGRVFGAPQSGGPSYRQFVDKSLLDTVLADLARLQPKLSQADWQLLQQHATAIRALEQRLASAVHCSTPNAQVVPPGLTPTDAVATHKWAMTPANFPAVGDLMSDIIAQAIGCGLTNVVTWMWANAEDDRQYPWLPQIDYTTTAVGAHGMAHERDPRLLYVNQWYAQQFNKLIDKLAAIPDSGAAGSVLDNSLLAWSTELGDSSSHLPNNTPVVLAGSNGGYFRTGRSIRFDDVWTPEQWSGTILGPSDTASIGNAIDGARVGDQRTVGPSDRSNNDLAVSILNSFGLEDLTFGDPRFCKGALPGVAVSA